MTRNAGGFWEPEVTSSRQPARRRETRHPDREKAGFATTPGARRRTSPSRDGHGPRSPQRGWTPRPQPGECRAGDADCGLRAQTWPSFRGGSWWRFGVQPWQVARRSRRQRKLPPYSTESPLVRAGRSLHAGHRGGEERIRPHAHRRHVMPQGAPRHRPPGGSRLSLRGVSAGGFCRVGGRH